MQFKLTDHQQSRFETVKTLLEGGVNRILIIGSAGTGKTTLSKSIIDWMRKTNFNPHFHNGQLFVCAPTNKALAILQSKIDDPVIFKTVHSALRMRAYRDKVSGMETFIRTAVYGKAKKEDFDRAKGAVIDEASMIPTKMAGQPEQFVKENNQRIKGYLEDYKFPIIYLGDNKQLNPVGEDYSPIFHHDFAVVELTEIVRQGEGNPIIDLSRDLSLIRTRQPAIVNGKGYMFSNEKLEIVENLSEANGSDQFKYLAYTNIEVDGMNSLVRQRIYGNPKKIEKHETIVFNKPYETHYTNEELKVEDLAITTFDVPVPTDRTRYDPDGMPLNNLDKIRMKCYRINDSINVVHEHSEKVFSLVFNTLQQNNRKFGWDGKGQHFFKDQFAEITYNHAITVHKSQGSTYKIAVVNVGNIDFNRKEEEHQRMLYTAVTRASDLVILNNVR